MSGTDGTWRQRFAQAAREWLDALDAPGFRIYAGSMGPSTPEREPYFRQLFGAELRARSPGWAHWVEVNIILPLEVARAACQADAPPELQPVRQLVRSGPGVEPAYNAEERAYLSAIADRGRRVRERFRPIFERLRELVDLLPDRDEPLPIEPRDAVVEQRLLGLRTIQDRHSVANEPGPAGVMDAMLRSPNRAWTVPALASELEDAGRDGAPADRSITRWLKALSEARLVEQHPQARTWRLGAAAFADSAR
jgi:hypothetical protein